MGLLSRFAFAAALTGALVAAHPAFAGCKRMGFTVNDYGKEGPTRDSKNLLDKHIATWAAEQGIEKYSVGKKDVSCELFLNLILFDEHTCTATATVCWGADLNKGSQQQAKTTPKPALKKEAAAKSSDDKADRAAEKSEPAKSEPAKSEQAKAEKSEPARSPEADQAKAESDSADLEETKAADIKPDTASDTNVETGAIPVPPTAAGTAAAVSPAAIEPETPSAEPVGTSENEASKAAAAAAESAAAAAERAAAAAERAAEAAERAAAAMAQHQPQPPPAAGAAPSSEPASPADTSPNAEPESAPSSSSVPVEPIAP